MKINQIGSKKRQSIEIRTDSLSPHFDDKININLKTNCNNTPETKENLKKLIEKNTSSNTSINNKIFTEGKNYLQNHNSYLNSEKNKNNFEIHPNHNLTDDKHNNFFSFTNVFYVSRGTLKTANSSIIMPQFPSSS